MKRNTTTPPHPTAWKLHDPYPVGGVYSPAAQVRRLSGSFYRVADWPRDAAGRLAIVAAMAARLAGSRHAPIHAAGFGRVSFDIDSAYIVTLPRPRILTDLRHSATAQELDRAADAVAGLALLAGARYHAARPTARAKATRHGIGWTISAPTEEGGRAQFVAWCRLDDGAMDWRDEPAASSPRGELQRPLYATACAAWAATAVAVANDREGPLFAAHTLRLLRAARNASPGNWAAIRCQVVISNLAHLTEDQRAQVPGYLESLDEDGDPDGRRAWAILHPESEEPPPQEYEIAREADRAGAEIECNASDVMGGYSTDEPGARTAREVRHDEARRNAEANESGEFSPVPSAEDAGVEPLRHGVNTITAPGHAPIGVTVTQRKRGGNR
jgi:hypothetical protein